MRKKETAVYGEIKSAVRRRADSLKNINKGVIIRAAVPLSVFFVSLILCPAHTVMGIYPFGTVMLCAVSGIINVSAAFTGAVLGTLSMKSGALWQILILSSVFILRLTSSVLLTPADRQRKGKYLFREPVYIRIIISAASAAASAMTTLIDGGGIYYGIFSGVFGIAVYTLFCASTIFLLDVSAPASKRLAGICVAAYGVTVALSDVSLPFRTDIMAAYFLTLWTTYAGGLGIGMPVGVAAGIAAGGSLSPMFPVISAVSGLIFDYNKTTAVIISTLCGVSLSMISGGFYAIADYMPEIVFSTCVAVPLLRLNILKRQMPKFLDLEKTEEFDVNGFIKEAGLEKEKYKKIAAALSSVSKMLIGVKESMMCPDEETAERICRSARSGYCSGCELEGECSGKCALEVDSFFSNMAHRLTTNGRVSARIVPEPLARRCYNMDAIIDTVNTAAKRQSAMSKCAEQTELLSADYSAVAELINEMTKIDSEGEIDRELEGVLTRKLTECGFPFSGASVIGSRQKKVYMRGVDMASVSAGEKDIRECAEEVLGAKLSPPEFSIDGKYISARMCSVFAYSLKCGRFSANSLRSNESGDSIISFRNDDGYFYTLVFDGMGSGREAAMISRTSAMFLEKLLRAGCPMKSALEMLNCFVSGAGENFTTVDLMETDLYTGRARFIKSGAAPSFVVRDGSLFRLHSKTVPVGIMRALDAESITFDLSDGDSVIMVSDGVTGSYEDSPWLYEMLSSGITEENSPEKCAKLIGEAAMRNTGRDDDITVCVMKVSKL